MSKSPIIIATAQSYISKDVRENGSEIRRLMTLAYKQGARVINFPEGAMSGYVGKSAQIEDWQEVDWEVLREELEETRKLARELKLWVALGCNHQLSEPHRPHNSIYIISDEGMIHTRYDKQWCSNNETLNWYTPGTGRCTFEVDGWKFGCAICIEIQFPELFIAYGTEDQIDCLLYSVFKDDVMFGIQAQAYAATNNYWFSVSNAQQKSLNLPSKMIGPNGKVQSTQANSSKLCISTLDMDDPSYDIALHKAKPWRAKARQPEFYASGKIDDERSSNRQEF